MIDFPSTKPQRQSPLHGTKLAPHHSRWLLGCYRDDCCELAVCTLSSTSRLTITQHTGIITYAQFWATLKTLRLSRLKWWLIGWRTKHMLSAADLMSALDLREVACPQPRNAGAKRQVAGRFNLGQTSTEIDLIIGKHKIKVLDFAQLGMTHTQLGLDLRALTLDDVARTLREYVGMCDAVGMSASKTTAAQAGNHRFRARHLPCTLSVNHDYESRALERAAFHNGRCECFRLGDIPEDTYSLDIRSCHATICRDMCLPVHLLEEWPVGLPVASVDHSGDDHWIAECTVNADTADYPLRWGDIPIYPVGRFHTTLCWPELRHALERGRVERITRAARYLARPALRGFANWFFDSRRALESSQLAHMLPTLKASFNAALGYQARHDHTWKPWPAACPWRWWTGVTNAPDHSAACVQAHVLDGHAEWLDRTGEPYDAMPMLQATVTSWARVRLLEVMELAGRGNVHYCDTDGILCSRQGWEALRNADGCIGSLPGQLTERFPSGRCRIGGQKNYLIGRNYICAGGIATRRSLLTDRVELCTPTGRCDSAGRVTPFEMDCEDVGGQEAKWRNFMTGQEFCPGVQ
jgi:hypothetical protein